MFSTKTSPAKRSISEVIPRHAFWKRMIVSQSFVVLHFYQGKPPFAFSQLFLNTSQNLKICLNSWTYLKILAYACRLATLTIFSSVPQTADAARHRPPALGGLSFPNRGECAGWWGREGLQGEPRICSTESGSFCTTLFFYVGLFLGGVFPEVQILTPREWTLKWCFILNYVCNRSSL